MDDFPKSNEMKSGKQRRLEIKAKRLENVLKRNNLDIYNTSRQIPTGAVAADHAELAHNNTYNSLPCCNLLYIFNQFPYYRSIVSNI